MARTVRDANSKHEPLVFDSRSDPSPTGAASKRDSRSVTGGGAREAPGSRDDGRPMVAMANTGLAPQTICRTLRVWSFWTMVKLKGPRGSGGERRCGERKGMIRGWAHSPSPTPWVNTSRLTSGAAARLSMRPSEPLRPIFYRHWVPRLLANSRRARLQIGITVWRRSEPACGPSGAGGKTIVSVDRPRCCS